MAHALGGGHTPDLFSLAVAALIVLAVGTWLGRRRRGAVALAAGLGLTQWALHSWFAAASAHCAVNAAALTGAHGHAPTGAGSHLAVTCAPADHAHMAMAASNSVTAALPHAMLLTHAVAVLVTAVLLTLAESGLRGVLTWLVPLIRLPRIDAAVPAPARAGVVVVAVDLPRVSDAVLACLRRRGPPRLQAGLGG